jgi:hypothetical protein
LGDLFCRSCGQKIPTDFEKLPENVQKDIEKWLQFRVQERLFMRPEERKS